MDGSCVASCEDVLVGVEFSDVLSGSVVMMFFAGILVSLGPVRNLCFNVRNIFV